MGKISTSEKSILVREYYNNKNSSCSKVYDSVVFIYFSLVESIEA